MLSTPSYPAPAELRALIQHHADALSLTIGFAPLHIPAEDKRALYHWLAQGYHGQMAFMAESLALRHDPSQLVEGSLSVISARLDYWSPTVDSLGQLSRPTQAYLSRYALGRDYHKVMRNKLKQLCLAVAQEIGDFQWRPFSDSAPILEHSLARQAGLGFIGKHSLLIHPQAGSSFFLGEVLCDLPLLDDDMNMNTTMNTTMVKPSCGGCTQCLTLCPTQAIVAPFVVDARRCISYLTIEYDGSIPIELRPLMGNRIYGCDDCQLVCPWNKYAQMTTEADFLPRHGLASASLLALWHWSEAQFLQFTEGSPIRRMGYQRWRRNLAVALGNAPSDPDHQRALAHALTTADDLVAEHITWAIQQHDKANPSRHALSITRSFLP